MIKNFLNLKKPLIMFDLETTGLNIRLDEIIELYALKFLTNGNKEELSLRIKPSIPVSEGSTKITGIKTEDLINEPSFKEVSKKVYEFFKETDLGGFNVVGFDLPVLLRELIKAGLNLDLSNAEIVDVKNIFHNKEPRNLTAALKFYCNEELINAHESKADVLATVKILESQINKYEDLSNEINSLSKFSKKENAVDFEGRFIWDEGEVIFSFGKYNGKKLKEIVMLDPDYLNWITNQEFSHEVKKIITNALKGTYPKKED